MGINVRYCEDCLKRNAVDFTKKYVNPSFTYSMNCLYIESKIKPKLLIVGTITPESGRGFYYTSPQNDMYKYLRKCNIINDDDYDNISKLKSLPNETIKIDSFNRRIKSENYKKNLKIIKPIYKTINNYGIYFFDVLSCAIRKKHNIASDSNISYGALDIETFKNKIDLKNTKIIVNSVEAFNSLLKLLNISHKDFRGEIIYLPQKTRNSYHKTKYFRNIELEDAWADLIKYCIYGKLQNKCFRRLIVKYSPNKTIKCPNA